MVLAWQLAQQIPVVAKVCTKAFRHGKHELTMRNSDRHVLGNIDRRDQHALLVAGRVDAALLTRKRDKQVVPTIRATHPGEAFAQVAATQKRINLALLP